MKHLLAWRPQQRARGFVFDLVVKHAIGGCELQRIRTILIHHDGWGTQPESQNYRIGPLPVDVNAEHPWVFQDPLGNAVAVDPGQWGPLLNPSL
ncbi:hypothetical protein L0A91_06200 [Ornithinimicrobium sp. INDO-MA30-4]|nr:hypothetical protein [Ornithinimicrobium sp. INDO-MA30-4]UJH71340.1 hypothetical protein L0A91_06200 [Ornithinimicrobium sp. INDO-MA30-4]